MVVEEPVAGSFSHFAYKYWGNFAGFASGWNYWVLYVPVAMAELTAVGIYVQYWWPEIPTGLRRGVLPGDQRHQPANVKVYGEMEFWFAIIKVVAIIGMIVFGAYLLFSGMGGPEATVTNLWAQGGFFPNGVMGPVMAMAVIMFSFGGLELVGITAAEADNPQKHSESHQSGDLPHPDFLYRFTGHSAVVVPVGQSGRRRQPVRADLPRTEQQSGGDRAEHRGAHRRAVGVQQLRLLQQPHAVRPAQQGNGPKSLLKVDGRGVPVVAIGISALATALCVLINYLIPAAPSNC